MFGRVTGAPIFHGALRQHRRSFPAMTASGADDIDALFGCA
jgi:hypothetical protein